MRSATLLSLLPTALALTITSPAGSQQINPGLPLTITWTSTSSDPNTISLILAHSSDNNDVLATNIPTSAGSYTVPAWWVQDYGIGYTLQAQQGSGGNVVAEVGGLSLGGGVGEITTDATGGLSFVSTAAIETASQASAATGGSAVTGVPGQAGTGSGSDLVTILSGSGTGSGAAASATGESASASESGSESGGSASSTGSESESSESASASRTGSAAASATSGTGDNAARGVKAAVGGVMGALAVALMA